MQFLCHGVCRVHTPVLMYTLQHKTLRGLGGGGICPGVGLYLNFTARDSTEPLPRPRAAACVLVYKRTYSSKSNGNCRNTNQVVAHLDCNNRRTRWARLRCTSAALHGKLLLEKRADHHQKLWENIAHNHKYKSTRVSALSRYINMKVLKKHKLTAKIAVSDPLPSPLRTGTSIKELVGT